MAGLKEDNKPFISAFDLIGAPVVTDDFVVGGTCTNNLYGMCESLYKPNMVSEPERCCIGLRVASHIALDAILCYAVFSLIRRRRCLFTRSIRRFFRQTPRARQARFWLTVFWFRFVSYGYAMLQRLGHIVCLEQLSNWSLGLDVKMGKPIS